ncbi:hypothetical protein CYMTET_25928 [Cymbomonas tetramitiformis]|uniref:Apple domain-containing protein n=1 Tax=Cymbomonas tetramitiformis TaxID=36881 RepID=A0AAE0FUE2_9CHLO|nr:hypothetical protein CYMTET_25928 [Cymbomonas tetramitiformis]
MQLGRVPLLLLFVGSLLKIQAESTPSKNHLLSASTQGREQIISTDANTRRLLGDVETEGSWTDLGEGCCIEATFLEYGNIGDLAACQERCRTFTDCGSVSHGWSGESSQWCNIQARFSCRTPLNLSHCGTGDERFGVHTFVYAELPSLEWVVQGGGSLRDTSSAVVLDEEGAAFVTGYFTDTATFGHFVLTSAGGYDIFTIKVSAGGNISWALRGGGALDDKGFAVAVDAESGVVYTAGEYKSETITFGSLVLGAGSSSSSDIFLAKISRNGAWDWVFHGGGRKTDRASAVATDGFGNVLVAGHMTDTATFGEQVLTSAGESDVLVLKVSAEGTVLWAAASGGSDSDKGYSLAVDLATSSIFVTGVFASAPATFAPDSILASAGGYDAFVLKLHASGTALWALRAGGSQYDYGESIAVDSAGDSVVAGSFFSTPASFGAFRLSSAGLRDAFVIKVSDAGSVLWVTHGMGSDSVQANGISVDSEDGAVATGAFMSTATFSSFTLTSSGVTDIFVMKRGLDQGPQTPMQRGLDQAARPCKDGWTRGRTPMQRGLDQGLHAHAKKEGWTRGRTPMQRGPDQGPPSAAEG